MGEVELMGHTKRGVSGAVGPVQGVAGGPCLGCNWRDRGEERERVEERKGRHFERRALLKE